MNEKITVKDACLLCTPIEQSEAARHFGVAELAKIESGMDMLAALVWIWERRRVFSADSSLPLPSWADIQGVPGHPGSGWSGQALNDYFEVEEIEADEAEPETDQGKGGSPAG